MFMFLQQTASTSPEYVQLCARITVCHLNSFADVATSFMSFASSSASSSPPFIAYCAFLTASIHLAALRLFKESTQVLPKDSTFMLDLLRKRALSSLLLLQRLQCYWSSCRQLVSGCSFSDLLHDITSCIFTKALARGAYHSLYYAYSSTVSVNYVSLWEYQRTRSNHMAASCEKNPISSLLTERMIALE